VSATAPAADRATALAEQRTEAALDRTFYAAERTLMAWIRTALSMISFGFTIVKVLEALEKSQGTGIRGLFGRSYSPETLGLALITIGTLSLLAAIVQYRQVLRALRKEGLHAGWSLSITVASLLALLGVFAFGGIVLRY